MTVERVDAVAAALTATGGVAGNVRQQRALVLDLLDGLRGVRVSELGKIRGLERGVEKSRLQERYMRVTGQPGHGEGAGEEGGGGQEGMEGVEGKVGEEDDGLDLVGVGELLG